MKSVEEFASALGMSVGALQHLTLPHRAHYRRFPLPKKDGGSRLISRPCKPLANAQRWIQMNVLNLLGRTPHAHGYSEGRSIATFAVQHVDKKVVLKLDLKEFFPSISYRRVRALFAGLGYSTEISAVFAMLCTEPSTEGCRRAFRQLPQGACTSPALVNLACRRLDHRLGRLGQGYGFVYGRYGDDLSFSGDLDPGDLLLRARRIIRSVGFEENEKKAAVMHAGQQQQLVGVVVNYRPRIDKEELRRLRAILHNAQKLGLESQNYDGRPNFVDYLEGKISWISMIDPVRGDALRAALDKVLPVTVGVGKSVTNRRFG